MGDASTVTSQKNTRFDEGYSFAKGRLRLICRRKIQPQSCSRIH